MSTKRLILMIIIAIGVFAAFMGYALRKIQTVEAEVTFLDASVEDQFLISIIEELNSIKDVALIDDSTIGFIRVLLVNHLSEEAVLWHDGKDRSVDYESLSDVFYVGNHYMAYVEKEATLILNCDPILGDPIERTVGLYYQQKYSNLSSLSPRTTDYFQEPGSSQSERYLRYSMIEHLRKAYLENEPLDTFAYHYHAWVEAAGEEHLTLAEYDYYDGFKAYCTLRVRLQRDPNYSLDEHIETYRNEYGIYSKSREYELIGLLWFLSAEAAGVDPFRQDDVRTDRYKVLLDGTAYGSVDDSSDYELYTERYEEYRKSLEEISDVAKRMIDDKEPSSMRLVSETYSDTIKISQNNYVYCDYIARQPDGTIIEADQMLVEVTPYSIKYYGKLE